MDAVPAAHRARSASCSPTGALGEIVTVIADHGQWFDEDPEHRLFAPELGGGALLDLGVYPVSFASMVLGNARRDRAVSDPAFTGVDAQTSMLFRYAGGAQAVLTCTLAARRPDARGDRRHRGADRDRRRLLRADELHADRARAASSGATTGPCDGRGLRHEADEVGTLPAARACSRAR